MGLIVETDGRGITIYRKDKPTRAGGTFATYCIKVSSKDKDGNWSNAFINVGFKKGVEVNNKAVIRITDSFFTVDKYNDRTSIKLMILEFKTINEGEGAPTQAQAPQNSNDGFMDIPGSIGEDVPFV